MLYQFFITKNCNSDFDNLRHQFQLTFHFYLLFPRKIGDCRGNEGIRRDIVAKLNIMFEHADSQSFIVEEVEVIVDDNKIQVEFKGAHWLKDDTMSAGTDENSTALIEDRNISINEEENK